MRIYKSDGTYTENPEDKAFGWTLNKSNESDEEMEKLEEEFRPKKPKKIIKYNPRIKMATIASVVETMLPPEGLIEDEADLNKIDLYFPTNTQLASLIDPCSVEAKMLLAVVHYAKYKLLENSDDVINLTDLKQFKFVLNQEIENDLKAQIADYHANKEENKLSLMMELMLADLNCDIPSKTPEKNSESSDLGNSLSYELSSEENKSSMAKSDYNRSELLSSIGFDDTIDKSLEKFTEETYEMNFKIAELKKSYKEDLKRVDRLINEARQLRREKDETKYLDDLILILNGNLEKVRPKDWPFRVFHENPPEDSLNLII